MLKIVLVIRLLVIPLHWPHPAAIYSFDYGLWFGSLLVQLSMDGIDCMLRLPTPSLNTFLQNLLPDYWTAKMLCNNTPSQ